MTAKSSSIDLVIHLPYRLGFEAISLEAEDDVSKEFLLQSGINAEIKTRLYPSNSLCLLGEELEVIQDLSVDGFTLKVCYLGFGLGYIEACRSLNLDSIDKQKINDMGHSLWNSLSLKFSDSSKLSKIILALEKYKPNELLDKNLSSLISTPKLLDCFSQTLVTVGAKNSFKQKIFGDEFQHLEHKNHHGCFLCSPSLNLVVVNHNSRINILDILSGATINMAMLYEIQAINLQLSRKLLDRKLGLKNIERYIDVFDIFISSQNQLLEEIKCEDFLGTDIEEFIGRPLLQNWGMSTLFDRSSEAVEHLTRQIDKAKNRSVRNSQKRQAKFFIFFTVLTVVSVTADILGVYDFKNQLSSDFRLILMLIIFLVGLLWAAIISREKV